MPKKIATTSLFVTCKKKGKNRREIHTAEAGQQASRLQAAGVGGMMR
jgi:hypothetical protein